MDLEEIKKIIEEDGGKFIIVENGQPIMVITSFAEYKKRLKSVRPERKNFPPSSQETEGEELKIEDLPF
jgi:hypothetical protein